MTPLEIGLIVALLLCFAAAAAMSLAEVSIIRVRRSRVLADSDQGERTSGQLLRLLDDLPIVMNTILLIVLLLQVTTAMIGGYLAQRWFGGLAVTATTIITTAVLFLYAEAIPKTVAIRSPHTIALRMTPVVSVLVRSLRPAVSGLVWLSEKQTPGSDSSWNGFTEEELRILCREAADAGMIERDDADLVERSFEFGDRAVSQVMVPRDQIAAVTADQTADDVITASVATGHRRLPICADGLDRIIGGVRLRDVAGLAGRSRALPVQTLASPVLRVAPEVPISDLLRLMQTSGIHLAIVTHADGRTLGLATIEDVVAELVGEIADGEPGVGVHVSDL